MTDETHASGFWLLQNLDARRATKAKTKVIMNRYMVSRARELSGDDGADELAEDLMENNKVTHLLLNSNKIGDAGAKALAEAIKKNVTLKFLSLFDNKIGDDGANALAEAFKVNSTLKQIDIRANPITDRGATALLESLEVNSTLTFLKIEGEGNKRSQTTLANISLRLRRNKHLAWTQRFAMLGDQLKGKMLSKALARYTKLTSKDITFLFLKNEAAMVVKTGEATKSGEPATKRRRI